MARRGVMTALQAALAGIGGAAGGYVQMEERKRKQKQEEDARAREDFLTRFSLTQAGARPRQAPVPGMAPEAPGTPPQYQSLGTFGEVEYEALTPEAKANQATQTEVSRLRSINTEQSKLARENFDQQLPQLRAALAQFSERDLPKNVRALVESGAFGLEPSQALKTAFDIAEGNRRLILEASRVSQAGAARGTFTAGEINKIIADKVSDLEKSLMTATKEVPVTRMVKGKDGSMEEVPVGAQTKRVSYKPEERKAIVDGYRNSLRAEYASLMPGGQPAAAPAGGAPSADPRTAAPTAPPRTAAPTAPRARSPMMSSSKMPPGTLSGIGESVGARLPTSFLEDVDRELAIFSGRQAAPFIPMPYTDPFGRKYSIR